MRLPFCLMGVLGIYAIYLCVSRFVSRRAGVFAAIVAATSPMYSLVARQAMTDMAFVGPMTMALALGALALFDDEDAVLPRRHWSRLPRVSWPDHPLFYATIAIFAVTALPQLIVNCIQLQWTFSLGSRTVRLVGIVVMLPYIAGALAFFILASLVRYKAPLYLFIAAILCGIATLAKGLAGLGLPVIIFLAYLAFTWNWRRLRRAQLLFGVAVALLACAVVAIPWHHAMLIRHGRPFWDELYGDNHWRRLVLGRHGDRGSFEYFLRELGYAVLPWLTIAPGALAALVMRPERNVRRQGIYWFGAIWFVSAYALVSMSVTKFHHYILPALPGLAIVIGCFLDDLLERRDGRAAGALAVVGLPLLALVMVDLVGAQNSAQHFIWLFSYDYINTPKGRPWPPALHYERTLIAFAIVFALGTRRAHWPAHPALGRVGTVRGGDGIHVLPARRLHATGHAVLDAEGAHRHLLPESPLTRREAAGLADVLARRKLLHRERDLRRPARRAHRLSRRPQCRELQSLGRQAPRSPRLPARRAHQLVADGRDGAAGEQGHR